MTQGENVVENRLEQKHCIASKCKALKFKTLCAHLRRGIKGLDIMARALLCKDIGH